MSNDMNSSNETYDIIIVGAGTAGCVLANRLSEEPNLRILVLEAGSNHNDDPRVRTPGLSGKCLGDSGIDWQFVSEPEEGLNGRTISQPRGKVIGGSSAINSHAVVHPSAAWLDSWAEFGNTGWGADELIPYYRKFHSVICPNPEVEQELGLGYTRAAHERGSGPIQASYPAAVHPLSKTWVETFETLGCRITDPFNAGSQDVGGGILPCALAGGERSHAGVAYLEPIQQRSNLKVLEDVLVEKVVFDTTQPRCAVAKGVQYRSHDASHTCHAEREVILCAGVFKSPQTLELSGIGNPQLLKSLGIQVVVPNFHVGENLQDHLNCGPSYEVKEGIPTADDARSPAYAEEAAQRYQRDRSGPLAGGLHNFGYASLQLFESEEETRELLARVDEVLKPAKLDGPAWPIPSQQIQDGFVRRMLSDPDQATATIYMSAIQRNLDQPESKRKAILQPGNYISLIAMLSYPFSRGSVHIRSANPEEQPTIDFRYLSHPLDVEVFARHLFAFEKLVKCEPLASMLKPDGRRLPATFAEEIDTVEKATKMLRQCAGTNYHPSCTCPMMSEELGGVVNDRLIVYGTKNLRVCDASVFPIIPRGNILSSVYAVAERGADIIKDDLKGVIR